MAKWQKLGVVLRGENGPFMVLGDSKGKKEYQYDVELVVRKNGKEVAKLKNPLVSLFDPRKRKDITEEQMSKIPDALRFEVSVKTEE